MKEPTTYSENEVLLSPFVTAAGTPSLQAACDLLFIHGNDLTWGSDDFGLFLVDVNTDEHFDEVVQVAETRLKLNLSSAAAPFLRKFQPHLIRMAAEVARDLPKKPKPGEKEKLMGRVLASEFASEQIRSELDQFAPEAFGLDQWMMLADALASSLLRSAILLRQRQLASTGKSAEDYQRMLYALHRLSLLDHIARVSYPRDSLNLEISVASRGEFKATSTVEDSNTIEWLRLKSDVASLKRGQERALALFISAHINGHHTGSRQAFANAQYGTSNVPELDVVIPALAVGFEVKLYQSPFAQTENKLVTLANQLARQLPSYAKAGCAHMFYVCNLSQAMAERVLDLAQKTAKVDIEMVAIGEGLGGLLPILAAIAQQLELFQQARFEQMIQTQAAPRKRSRSKHRPSKR